MKHPTPWRYHEERQSNGASLTLIYDCVRDARDMNVVRLGGPACTEVARLIAAAPDLLAACNALYIALREYTDEGETDAQKAILAQAEAAIEKAGSSP